MKRIIKLNNKSFNIVEGYSISETGGDQFMIIEPLTKDYKLSFTTNFIQTQQKMILPKDIHFIDFNDNNAIITLNNNMQVIIPCQTNSIQSQTFVMEFKKTRKLIDNVAVWKVLHNINEPLNRIEFIREN